MKIQKKGLSFTLPSFIHPYIQMQQSLFEGLSSSANVAHTVSPHQQASPLARAALEGKFHSTPAPTALHFPLMKLFCCGRRMWLQLLERAEADERTENASACFMPARPHHTNLSAGVSRAASSRLVGRINGVRCGLLMRYPTCGPAFIRQFWNLFACSVGDDWFTRASNMQKSSQRRIAPVFTVDQRLKFHVSKFKCGYRKIIINSPIIRVNRRSAAITILSQYHIFWPTVP